MYSNRMKTECRYCGKIVTDPFIDTDQKGRFFFFCDQYHRDLFSIAQAQGDAILFDFLFNPITQIRLLGYWLKDKFKSMQDEKK